MLGMLGMTPSHTSRNSLADVLFRSNICSAVTVKHAPSRPLIIAAKLLPLTACVRITPDEQASRAAVGSNFGALRQAKSSSDTPTSSLVAYEQAHHSAAPASLVAYRALVPRVTSGNLRYRQQDSDSLKLADERRAVTSPVGRKMLSGFALLQVERLQLRALRLHELHAIGREFAKYFPKFRSELSSTAPVFDAGPRFRLVYGSLRVNNGHKSGIYQNLQSFCLKCDITKNEQEVK